MKCIGCVERGRDKTAEENESKRNMRKVVFSGSTTDDARGAYEVAFEDDASLDELAKL